jgi:hypothetical protein
LGLCVWLRCGLDQCRVRRGRKSAGKFDLTNPDRLRSDLRDYLLTTKNRVLTGFTGDIQFNGGNQRDFPPKLVAYARSVQTPYVLQLNETPILAQSIEHSANYLKVGAVAYRLIPAEKVGLSVLRFYNIEYGRGVFDADFVIWIRSKDPPELSRLVFTNALGELRNVRTISDVRDRLSSYRSYGATGTFTFHFAPADIILDSPRVSIQFRDRQLDRGHLQFVEDSTLGRDDAEGRENVAIEAVIFQSRIFWLLKIFNRPPSATRAAPRTD